MANQKSQLLIAEILLRRGLPIEVIATITKVNKEELMARSKI